MSAKVVTLGMALFGSLNLMPASASANQDSVTAQGGARESVDQLLARMGDAHGVPALANVRSWVIKSTYKVYWPGSYREPGVIDDRDRVTVAAYDRNLNAGSFETWEKGFSGFLHTLDLVRGGTGVESNRSFDLTMEQTTAPQTLESLLASTSYFTPFLLARLLAEPRSEARLAGAVTRDGKEYLVLEASIPGGAGPMAFLVDAKTHLIAGAIRDRPGRSRREYSYAGYHEQDGIMVAGTVSFHTVTHYYYTEGFAPADPPTFDFQLVELSERTVAFNEPVADYLAEPEEVQSFEPAPIHSSEDYVSERAMTATRLSDRAYHVGRFPAYSMFVDAGDYIVAAGPYANFAARFAKFKEVSGIDKPLRYVIVTSHHTDQIAGLPEAYKLGARVVTVAEHLETVRQVLPEEAPADRLVVMSGKLALGDAAREAIEVHEFSTGYGKQALMLYLPRERVIFIRDHGNSSLKTGLPEYDEFLPDLLGEIERLHLDVERVARVHGSRLFTLPEMREAAALPVPHSCYNNRPICAGRAETTGRR